MKFATKASTIAVTRPGAQESIPSKKELENWNNNFIIPFIDRVDQKQKWEYILDELSAKLNLSTTNNQEHDVFLNLIQQFLLIFLLTFYNYLLINLKLHLELVQNGHPIH